MRVPHYRAGTGNKHNDHIGKSDMLTVNQGSSRTLLAVNRWVVSTHSIPRNRSLAALEQVVTGIIIIITVLHEGYWWGYTFLSNICPYWLLEAELSLHNQLFQFGCIVTLEGNPSTQTVQWHICIQYGPHLTVCYSSTSPSQSNANVQFIATNVAPWSEWKQFSCTRATANNCQEGKKASFILRSTS